MLPLTMHSLSIFAFLSCTVWAAAFRPSLVASRAKNLSQKRQCQSLEATRRSFIENLAVTSIASVVLSLPAEKAYASGGATAGGAYLLSAKQRYNDRVTQGVKGFVSLRSSLESGDIAGVRAFFAGEEEGGWKDL